MPAFFEVDPRLTKDSVIVLMHDATLDRTTDATGNFFDFEDGKNGLRDELCKDLRDGLGRVQTATAERGIHAP